MPHTAMSCATPLGEQRKTFLYGACKVLATIEDQHWPTAGSIEIEWQLQAYGYPQACQLLYHARVRERLDAICAEAQRSPTEAFDSDRLRLIAAAHFGCAREIAAYPTVSECA